MTRITDKHIERLIQLESGVTYAAETDDGTPNYTVIDRPGRVLISAPHGAKTFRNNRFERWHSEDAFTGGMALLLSEICQVPAIVTIFPNFVYDPNYSRFDVPYKNEIRDWVDERGVRYVLDLHGASAHTDKMDPGDKIDLGYRSKNKADRSMRAEHIDAFTGILRGFAGECYESDFRVSHNRFAARRCYTITSFVHNLSVSYSNPDVEAVQIELKPHLRIANRTEYRENVKIILQALVAFIVYLKKS